MKGKIAFVIGAAVGYVLGSRAGRERYEQIKRGAESAWNTAPVQKVVGQVENAVQERVDNVKRAVGLTPASDRRARAAAQAAARATSEDDV